MLGKGFSLAVAAFVVGAFASVGACSSNSATIPDADAGSSEPTDAAPPPEDAASNNAADTGGGVTITYGQCPAFTKCGGNIVGSWHLTGGCLSDQTFAPAKQQCPQLKESNISMHATGALDVTATGIQRSTAITLSGHIEMPKSCVPFPGATCDTVAALLKNPQIFPGGFSFKNATCADNTTDAKLCECDASTDYSENVDTTYTSTPDGTLTTPPTTGSASPRTYEFCVAGAGLTFTETSQSQPLRFFATLAKN